MMPAAEDYEGLGAYENQDPRHDCSPVIDTTLRDETCRRPTRAGRKMLIDILRRIPADSPRYPSAVERLRALKADTEEE